MKISLTKTKALTSKRNYPIPCKIIILNSRREQVSYLHDTVTRGISYQDDYETRQNSEYVGEGSRTSDHCTHIQQHESLCRCIPWHNFLHVLISPWKWLHHRSYV